MSDQHFLSWTYQKSVQGPPRSSEHQAPALGLWKCLGNTVSSSSCPGQGQGPAQRMRCNPSPESPSPKWPTIGQHLSWMTCKVDFDLKGLGREMFFVSRVKPDVDGDILICWPPRWHLVPLFSLHWIWTYTHSPCLISRSIQSLHPSEASLILTLPSQTRRGNAKDA